MIFNHHVKIILNVTMLLFSSFQKNYRTEFNDNGSDMGSVFTIS